MKNIDMKDALQRQFSSRKHLAEQKKHFLKVTTLAALSNALVAPIQLYGQEIQRYL